MFPAGDDRFRVGWVEVPSGIVLRVVESGAPDSDRVVVCVHGWACSSYTFRRLLPELGVRGYRAIALDLPGHGLSDKPEGGSYYTLDALAGVVLAVMDTLGVERARLAGHSMGGAIVARAAVLAPGRVESLVLMAPAGYGRELAMRALAVVTPGFVRRVAPSVVPRWLFAMVMRLVYGARYRPVGRDVDEYWAPTQFPGYARALVRLLHEFPWTAGPREGFGSISVPVVVMEAEREHFVLRGWARGYAAGIPGARLVMVRGSGHVIPEEAPEDVAGVIEGMERGGSR